MVSQIRSIVILVIFSITLIYTSKSLAEGDLNSTKVDSVTRQLACMPLAKIKAGQTGYGLTVFQGSQIKKFQFVVLGILKNYFSGSDAIIVKLIGPEFAKNSLIKGMSGSPIYIDNKLVGAVSFGFDFATEPIVGVTPIDKMLESTNEPVINNLDSVPIANVNNEYQSNLGNLLNAKKISLLSPITLTGFSQRSQEYLRNIFQYYAMDIASGVTGNLDTKDNSQSKTSCRTIFNPGSSISVLLTQGDFGSAATGTVTAKVKNRVIAYGHPLFKFGYVDFPIAESNIITVLPMLTASVKLANPKKVCGSMFNDMPWAISGDIDRKAQLVDVNIEIQDVKKGLTKKFNVKVVNHPKLTPSLTAACAISAIDTIEWSATPYVVDLNSDFDIKGFGIKNKKAILAINFEGKKFIADSVSSLIEKTVDKIYNNNFSSTCLNSINLKLKIYDQKKLAKIENVSIDTNEVSPGDTLSLNCTIKPYLAPKYKQTITLKIPDNLPNGELPIIVSSDTDAKSLEEKIGIQAAPSTNMTSFLNNLFKPYLSNKLTASIALPYPKVVLNDISFDNPPPTWFDLNFTNNNSKGIFTTKSKLSKSIEQNYVLVGQHMLTVKVASVNKYKAFNQDVYPDTVKSQIPNQEIYSTSDANKISNSANLKSAVKILSKIANLSQLENKQKDEKTKVVNNTITSSIAHIDDSIVPHSRLNREFLLGDFTSFNYGTFHNCNVNTIAELKPTPKVEEIDLNNFILDEKLIALQSYKNIIAFSASNKIFFYNIDLKKIIKKIELPNCLVTTLCFDNKGYLYSGLSNSNKIIVFKNIFNSSIQDEAARFQFEKLVDIDCQIFNSMVISNDIVFVGTSNKGKIIKINLKDDSQTSICVPANHVVCMAYNNTKKMLYIGTSQPGIVYSLDDNNILKSVYQSTESTISGIGFDKFDNTYISTTNSGHLIMLSKDIQAQTIGDSEAFYSLINTSKGVISGDAEGDITKIEYDNELSRSFFLPLKHTHCDSVIAGCENASNNDIYMLCRNGNKIIRITNNYDDNPNYLSPIFDSTDPAIWQKLIVFNEKVNIDHELNQSITILTRSGNSLIPDKSWSEFKSCELTNDKNYFVPNSPCARYLQFKVIFNDKKHVVSRFILHTLPANHQPYFISLNYLRLNESLKGTKNLTITCDDSDNDNLMLRMLASNDNGQTYQFIKQVISDNSENSQVKAVKNNSKLQSKQDQIPQSDIKVDDSKNPDNKDDINEDTKNNTSQKSKLKSDKPIINGDTKNDSKVQSKDESKNSKSNITDDKSNKPDNKESINKISTDKALSTIKQDKKSKSNLVKSQDKKNNVFKFDFDTKELKDGFYLLKFDLSDKISNFDNHKSAHYYAPVIIDNTKPQIKDINLKVMSDKLNLSFKAIDNIEIYSCSYKFDDRHAFSLTANPNLKDSKEQIYDIKNISKPKHSKEITITAFDKAGNSTSTTLKL